jgi:hypothetical protein
VAQDKATRLQPIRVDAGMLIAGLERLRPPSELESCRAQAIDGAKRIRQTLDLINELWMNRLPPEADPRVRATALAMALCDGFADLQQGRRACGVPLPPLADEDRLRFACPE